MSDDDFSHIPELQCLLGDQLSIDNNIMQTQKQNKTEMRANPEIAHTRSKAFMKIDNTAFCLLAAFIHDATPGHGYSKGLT